MGVCARVPYGPLPVEMVTVCDVTMLPVPLHVALEAVGVRSITPAQRQRDATAPIFGNVSDDSMLLLQPFVDLCEAFARACGHSASVSEAGVMQRLLSAEVTVQLNYGIPAAVEWADSFVFPPRCGPGIGSHRFVMACSSSPCCLSSTSSDGTVICPRNQ